MTPWCPSRRPRRRSLCRCRISSLAGALGCVSSPGKMAPPPCGNQLAACERWVAAQGSRLSQSASRRKKKGIGRISHCSKSLGPTTHNGKAPRYGILLHLTISALSRRQDTDNCQRTKVCHTAGTQPRPTSLCRDHSGWRDSEIFARAWMPRLGSKAWSPRTAPEQTHDTPWEVWPLAPCARTAAERNAYPPTHARPTIGQALPPPASPPPSLTHEGPPPAAPKL